jgi:hypothetical protein
MADDWWSDFLARLFGAESAWAQSAQARGRAGMDLGARINAELQRQESIASTAASPTPTPQATGQQQQQPRNPNARDDEAAAARARDSALGVPAMSDLYGTVPQGKVYMGNKRVMRGQNLQNSPVLEDIGEVIAQVNEWSPKKIKKFNELAIDAGYLKEPTKNLDEIERIWSALAIRSAKMWERQIGLTPWQILERYGARGTGDDAGRASGPVTTTTVNRTINLTSPRDANALVDAALQQRLGRSPTDKEKKDFLAALREAEKKEPSITKTTTTTTGSGTESVSSTSNTETSGGVDTSNFAREWALQHNKDEAGSYQALAYYMPLFYQALESPV